MQDSRLEIQDSRKREDNADKKSCIFEKNEYTKNTFIRGELFQASGESPDVSDSLEKVVPPAGRKPL
jgi:hypothetical protein